MRSNLSRGKTAVSWMLCLLFFLTITTHSLAQETPRVAHVFVALADNQNQGIVPVPPRLGNGSDPVHNLYWGAAAGVKTFFMRSADWTLLNCTTRLTSTILERCVFKYRDAAVYLVADAYQGNEIKQAIVDFFDAASGGTTETVTASHGSLTVSIPARAGSNLIAFVGHDGLMDFRLPGAPQKRDNKHRDAIILACASKQYFAASLRTGGAYPLLWTTNLMAPEAYTLKAALDGWIQHESGEQIRERAASAYDKYQKCGLRGARRLFASGW